MVSPRSLVRPTHPLRRGYRDLLARWRLATNIRSTGMPADAVYFPLGGLGDDLLGSALAVALSEQRRGPVWVLSHHRELFLGLPAVSAVVPPSEELVRRLENHGTCIRRTTYTECLDAGTRHAIPSEHIIAAMARHVGYSGRLLLRPHLRLSHTELDCADIARDAIVIQSSGRAARFHIPTKEWQPGKFIQVAERLSARYKLVQIGSASDPLLPGCIDLRGCTTLRQTAGLLARANLFVGLVGFLMHLARAVDCRAVIVYGGREAPWQSGYPCNENVTSAPPCSPCWLVDGCEHALQCMQAISADQVISAVERALTRHGQLLATDSIQIGDT